MAERGPKFTIPHGAVWQRPDEAYFDFQTAAAGIDQTKLKDGRYKALREKRDVAVFGAAIYRFTETPTFVQMNDVDDSPDAFLLQKDADDKLTANVAAVEITFYGANKLGPPAESLAERLSKPGGKFREKLPDRYWLLVHIGVGLNPDHQAVADVLAEMDAKFDVYSIQEISNHPDTIVRFVRYNPKLEMGDLNLGEVMFKFRETDIPGRLDASRGLSPRPTEP